MAGEVISNGRTERDGQLPLWWLALGLAACLAGCGGGQTRAHPLDRQWSDEDGSELAAFQLEWDGRVRVPAGANVIVGVLDDQTLVGQLLDGSSWRFEHPLEGRPRIAGQVVVGLGGGELFALRAADGELLWTRKSLGSLRGAGDDGETTIVSIASLSQQRSIVLAVARSGAVRRQLDVPVLIGQPAVFDSYAFLPWDQKWVTIFDLTEGREAARVVSTHPLSHALVVAGELYFLGPRGALRFDEQIVAARKGRGTLVTLPDRAFPGDPWWLPAAGQLLPTHATERDTVRFYWRPTREPKPRISTYLLTYRQIAVGLDGGTAATRWAHAGDQPFIGGAAATTGYLLCDAGGGFVWLDQSTGHPVVRGSLGAPLVACLVQCSGAPPVQARGSSGRAPLPLAVEEQLFRALSPADPRLLPLQLELLDDLAGLPTAAAAERLIALASEERVLPQLAGFPQTEAEPQTPPASGEPLWPAALPAPPWDLQLHAARRLAQRRHSPAVMLAALRRFAAQDRERWLPWRRPHAPAVAALAQALAALGEGAAAPLLAGYLTRPGLLSSAESAAVATAAASLATAAEVPQLSFFFSRHRCTPADPELRRAVVHVARALIRLGGADAVRRVVAEDCRDPALLSGLRQALADG